MRRWLASSEWADPLRLAASAAHLREADEALDWALVPLAAARLTEEDGTVLVDATGLPRELQRRLLLAAFARLGAPPPRGPDLTAALGRLRAGQTTTLCGLKLAGLKVEGSEQWHLSTAPARRLTHGRTPPGAGDSYS